MRSRLVVVYVKLLMWFIDVLFYLLAQHEEEIGMENFPNEMTFAPTYSSTCNFSKFPEAARLASTPYAPCGEIESLPDPSVSHIKPAQLLVDDKSSTEGESHSDATNRRASIFSGRQNTQQDLRSVPDSVNFYVLRYDMRDINFPGCPCCLYIVSENVNNSCSLTKFHAPLFCQGNCTSRLLSFND